MSGRCWLCGRNGAADPLDMHHIFGGALRDKSERYGLTVRLCHERCHIFGREAVHQNAAAMQRLKEYGQRKAMEENGWDEDDFRREFGKNYLPPSVAYGASSPGGGAALSVSYAAEGGAEMAGRFRVLEAAVLPY